ncbi:MAG TPA: hypothetical protein VFY71_00990 [Planctomycetota bacterium]|nr:hypothetical protein [Planctomycetota bacterium]
MLRIGSLLVAVLVLLPPGGGESSGFDRFLKKQADAAGVAERKKDWPAAFRAWDAVLELDRHSLEGLQGLVESAQAAGDLDQEILARLELVDALQRAVSQGDINQVKPLAAARERLAAIDPTLDRREGLLAQYSESQKELATGYEAQGMPANAIMAWTRRMNSCVTGSPERAEAIDAIDRLRKTSPGYVAERFDPGVVKEEHDEAWIAAMDKKSAQFSSCLLAETPHYRIKTNAGWRMLQAASTAMELVASFYREIWGVLPDPPPEKAPEGLRQVHIPTLDVQIFKTRDEYIHRTGTGKSDWSGGHYNGGEVNTYDQGESGGKNGIPATMHVLFHEASHQFMGECVGGTPGFVNEGVASLFEGIDVLPNGEVRRDLPVMGYLIPLCQAFQDGSAMKLRDVFKANENEPKLYKYRWGVFYFVRMYVDSGGRYPFRDKLDDYIYEFKKGDLGNLDQHFVKFFLEPANIEGLRTFDEFETTWKAWILGLYDEIRASDKRLVEYRTRALSVCKPEPAEALPFCERALDIDPDDIGALYATAVSCDGLKQTDRAVATWRKVLAMIDDSDARRKEGLERVAKLDPLDAQWKEARVSLAGGMTALALEHDTAGRPLTAMALARMVLKVDTLEPSARALTARVERETGRTIQRWERLYNGFDLKGWYGAEGGDAFLSKPDGIVCDSAALAAARAREAEEAKDNGKKKDKKGKDAPPPPAEEGITYQALLSTREVAGDYTVTAHIQTEAKWQIVGLIFGAKDKDHYEAIVLRHGDDGTNRVDFGAMAEGAWTHPHNDGALKADYDPAKGVDLGVTVRGREVTVTINGQVLKAIVGKKYVTGVKYPLAALRGDIGLLGSNGTTTFSDVRLQADDEP